MIIICFYGRGQNPALFMSLLKPMKKGDYFKGINKWGWYDRDYDENIIDKGISRDITKNKDCILIGFS